MSMYRELRLYVKVFCCCYYCFEIYNKLSSFFSRLYISTMYLVNPTEYTVLTVYGNCHTNVSNCGRDYVTSLWLHFMESVSLLNGDVNLHTLLSGIYGSSLLSWRSLKWIVVSARESTPTLWTVVLYLVARLVERYSMLLKSDELFSKKRNSNNASINETTSVCRME